MLNRCATAADCAAIAQLARHYWESEHLSGFDAVRVASLLQEFLRRPEQGICWVAESHGVLRGYLLAAYVFSLEHGGTMAEIDEFFTLRETRSAGIGSALLESATSHMAACGIVRIQLQLGIANQRAQKFYQRHGFVPRAGYALWDRPA